MGLIPLFVSTLQRVAPARRRLVLCRELLISIGVLLAFLLLGERIAGVLGKRGLVTMERLMGMLAVAIAVKMFLGGISAYLELQRAAAAGL